MTFLAAARELLDGLERGQEDALEEASALCAEAIGAGGLAHAFGTGHSRIAVEELFPLRVVPGIRADGEALDDVPHAGHRRERAAPGDVPRARRGLAETILANFRLAPPEVMMVFSSGGANAVPVEMALGARARGLPVIAVTAVAASRAPATGRSRGTRLPDHADVVLDLRTPPGDALVALEGLDAPVAPGSTLAAVALVNEVKARTAVRLNAAGVLPPVITSPSLVGAERSRALFDAAYAEHARRLARALRTTDPEE